MSESGSHYQIGETAAPSREHVRPNVLITEHHSHRPKPGGARATSGGELDFLVRAGLTRDVVARTLAEARQLGVLPQHLLFANGLTTPAAYVVALARSEGVAHIAAGDQAGPGLMQIDATGQSVRPRS